MTAQIPVSSIMIRYFVRNDRLNDLIFYAFEGLDSNQLNIYIDLYGLYHTIFSRHYITDTTDYTSFTVYTINMCAHYRAFFKYRGVHTKIFLISSFNMPPHVISKIPEYNKTMAEKRKNQLVNSMMELDTGLLELLCPYLPDIFYLKTNYESAVLMNYIIQQKEDQSIPSLIISSDLMPLQLTYLNNNVSFLWPRKLYPDDASVICPQNSHENYKQDFFRIFTLKQGNNSRGISVSSLFPCNSVLLEAISRYPERDLKSIYNLSRACKMIYDIAGSNDTPITPNLLFSVYEKDIKDKIPTIQERYNALNVGYQSLLYQESIESKTIHYENLNDPDAIRMINERYFAKNPIDIYKL